MGSDMPVALLSAVLGLVEIWAQFGGYRVDERASLRITSSILALNPASKSEPLPSLFQKKIASAAAALLGNTGWARSSDSASRHLLFEKTVELASGEPDKYSLSRDRERVFVQAAPDGTRRGLSVSIKTVARELHMDALSNLSDARNRTKRIQQPGSQTPIGTLLGCGRRQRRNE
jgi:hypothetical protein